MFNLHAKPVFGGYRKTLVYFKAVTTLIFKNDGGFLCCDILKHLHYIYKKKTLSIVSVVFHCFFVLSSIQSHIPLLLLSRAFPHCFDPIPCISFKGLR